MSPSGGSRVTIMNISRHFKAATNAFNGGVTLCLCRPTSGYRRCGNRKGGLSMYDARKYGHSLPMNNVCPKFATLRDIPTGMFRNTHGELLEGVGKDYIYKNPEYFSYHHMSYYDVHLHLRKYRQPLSKLGS